MVFPGALEVGLASAGGSAPSVARKSSATFGAPGVTRGPGRLDGVDGWQRGRTKLPAIRVKNAY